PRLPPHTSLTANTLVKHAEKESTEGESGVRQDSYHTDHTARWLNPAHHHHHTVRQWRTAHHRPTGHQRHIDQLLFSKEVRIPATIHPSRKDQTMRREQFLLLPPRTGRHWGKRQTLCRNQSPLLLPSSTRRFPRCR
ncbi:unnamed protein product, partial [Ectocarpus sp. 12 AP-2014]